MAYKIKNASAAGNVYFTTSNGVMRLTGPTALYQQAGIIQPVECDVFLVAAMPGITMAINDSFAYRVVFGYIDANNNTVLSPPSNPVIIAAGAANTFKIQITVRTNGVLDTNYFYQIYRSKLQPGGPLTYINPGDELYLTYQDFFTNADIGSGQVIVFDIRADEILGPPLYTDPSQQTISNANYEPPYCRTLVYFKNCMFYMNCLQRQTLEFQIIGTQSTAGQTITIAGTVYTIADTATTDITLVQKGVSPVNENAATGTFVHYQLVANISQQIEGTARSLCRVINGNPANSQVFAYYDSVPGGPPGIIRLVSRIVNNTPFTITVSATALGLNFEPILPTTGTSIISTNNEAVAGCYISKPEEPDHAPLYTFRVIGDRKEKIQHAFALKDSIIVIKENSIWRGAGDSIKNFTFSILDATVSIRDSYESCATLDNKVHAISNQGPVAISETGVELIGRAEEYNILKGIIGFPDGFSNGVGIEPKRTFLVCTYDPELKQKNLANPTSFPYPYSTFAYNYATGTWARWLINSNTFAVLGDRLFYGLNNANGIVMEERLPTVASETNYYDETNSVTITAVNHVTNVITLTFTKSVDYAGYFDQWSYLNDISPGFENLSKGWIIQQGNNQYVVKSFSSGPGTAVLNTTVGLVNGTLSTFRPIPVTVEYTATFADQPAALKTFIEVVSFGDFSNCYELIFDFMNQDNFKDFRHYYTWNPSGIQRTTKPLKPFLPGSDQNNPIPILTPKNAMQFFDKFVRCQVPRQKNSCAFINLRISNVVANSSFLLKGICFNVGEEQTVKLAQ